MRPRKTGIQVQRGRLYGRFWLGGKARESVPLPAVTGADEKTIRARCDLIDETIAELVAAGRADKAKDFATQLGAATSQKKIEIVLKAAREAIKRGGSFGENITFKQFGERWTSGEL